MRICLLTTQNLDADPFPEDDWPCDPRPFMPEAEWHVATLVGKVNSVRQVEALIDENRFDLFFNLCDGAADQDIPGIEVIEKLEEKAAYEAKIKQRRRENKRADSPDVQ